MGKLQGYQRIPGCCLQRNRNEVARYRRYAEMMQKLIDFLSGPVKLYSPYPGLDVSKYTKYYEFPMVHSDNVFGNMDKKQIMARFILELQKPNGLFDPKNNKLGLRSIRSNDQWKNDYNPGKLKVLVNKKRDKKDKIEKPYVGQTVYIDITDKECNVKRSYVGVIKTIHKDLMVVKTDFGKNIPVNAVYNNPIEICEKEECQDFEKATVYKFIGICSKKSDIKELSENLLSIDCVLGMSHIKSKLVLKNKKKNDNFSRYNVEKGENRYDAPGAKFILKIVNGSLIPFFLIETIVEKDKTINQFTLMQLFKFLPKKKDS